jgi:PAS domain S-box-containing protein
MTQEQSRGWGWARVLHPEDVERVRNEWARSVSSGTSLEMEYRIRTKTGRWRWVLARAAARLDSEGKVVRWYGWLEDIDLQRRERLELEERATQMEAVFEALPVGIVIVEALSGQVMMGNRQAEAILGHSIAETPAAGREWRLYDRKGRRMDTQENPLLLAIKNGETTTPKVYCYHREDGTQVWVSISAAPVRGEAGKLIGGVMTIQDAETVHDAGVVEHGLRA